MVANQRFNHPLLTFGGVGEGKPEHIEAEGFVAEGAEGGVDIRAEGRGPPPVQRHVPWGEHPLVWLPGLGAGRPRILPVRRS